MQVIYSMLQIFIFVMPFVSNHHLELNPSERDGPQSVAMGGFGRHVMATTNEIQQYSYYISSPSVLFHCSKQLQLYIYDMVKPIVIAILLASIT